MMKHTLVSFLCFMIALISQAQSCGEHPKSNPALLDKAIMVGAQATTEYLPFLEGKRVAVMTNQTGMVGDEHLVDLLNRLEVRVVGIFSPEHGLEALLTQGSALQALWIKRLVFQSGHYMMGNRENHQM